jgi:hypothetical protein
MKKKLVSILLSMAMCASYVTPLSASVTTDEDGYTITVDESKVATPASVEIEVTKGADKSKTVNLGKNAPTDHQLTAKVNWVAGSNDATKKAATIDYDWESTDPNVIEVNGDGKKATLKYVGSGSAIISCKVSVNGTYATKTSVTSGGNVVKDHPKNGEENTENINTKEFDKVSTATFGALSVQSVDINTGCEISFGPASGTFYKGVGDFSAAWGKKTKKKAAENTRVLVKEKQEVNGKTTQLDIGSDFTADLDTDVFYSNKEDFTVGAASNAGINLGDKKRHAIVNVTVKGDGTNYIGTTTKAIEFEVLPQVITVTGQTSSGIYAEDKEIHLTYGDVNDKWLTTDEKDGILLFDGWTAKEFNNDAALAMKYKSANSKIVKVDKKGKLTAKKAGTANVDVMLKNDTTKKITLKVVVDPKKLSEINVDEKTKKQNMEATINAESAKDVKLAKSYKDFATFKSKFMDKWAKKFVIHNDKKKLKGGDNKDFKATFYTNNEEEEELSGIEGFDNSADKIGKTDYKKTCKVVFEGKGNYSNTFSSIIAVPFETQQLKLFYKNTTIMTDDNVADLDENSTYKYAFGNAYDLSELISEKDSFEGLSVVDAKALKKSQKVKYKSLDKTIAKVSSTGKVTLKKGDKTAKFEIWPAKNPNAKVTLSVYVAPKNIKDVTVKAPKIKGKQLSDSAAQSAFNKERVVVKDGSKKLKYNVDYTVEIESCAKGTLKFKVVGKGSYENNTSSNSVSYDPKTT